LDVDEMTEKSEKVFHEELYKNNGMAIFVKGRMVVGIHPDDLIGILEGLSKENIKFDWSYSLEIARKGEGK
jgi:hypothetical protein